jgi:sodium/bile acid cotransporter 7
MLHLLLKRWFLVALLLGIVIGWFRPQWLAWSQADIFSPRFLIGPVLFLMSWSLPTDKVLQSLRNPWPALWATFLSYTLVPALAWLAGYLTPQTDFQIGLLIMASVPCTLASVVIWTRLGGGNEATALLVVTIATATSFVLTSAWLTATTGTAVQLNLSDMMLDLFVNMLLPIGLGQLLRLWRTLANFATGHKKILSIIDQCLILLIIFRAAHHIGVEMQQRPAPLPALTLLSGIALPIGIHLIALMVGLESSKFFRFARPDQVAVAFASSQKTLPVALLVFSSYYQKAYPLALLPVAFWHFGQLVVDTFIAEHLAKKHPHPLEKTSLEGTEG